MPDPQEARLRRLADSGEDATAALQQWRDTGHVLDETPPGEYLLSGTLPPSDEEDEDEQ